LKGKEGEGKEREGKRKRERGEGRGEREEDPTKFREKMTPLIATVGKTTHKNQVVT